MADVLIRYSGRHAAAQQQQTRTPNGQQPDDSRRYWEEKRLMFLLGSTSILFSVCITPQLVLSLMIHEAVLQSYYFQVQIHQPPIISITRAIDYPRSLRDGRVGFPGGGQHSRGDQLLFHLLHLLHVLPRFPSHPVPDAAHLDPAKWGGSDLPVKLIYLFF